MQRQRLLQTAAWLGATAALLGVFAGLINLPVRETPIHRPAVGQQPLGA